MNQIRKLLQHEKGGYEMTEAAIMYPFTFLMIMFVMYVGIYLVQLNTVSSYAQKIALLAAREVSCPGYSNIVNGARYSTSAAELDFDLSGDVTEEGKSKFEGKININNKVEDIQLRAYRYWFNPLNDEEKDYYSQVLHDLVQNNSVMRGASGNSVTATVDCQNYVVVQYITTDVEQELIHFGLLDFLGVKQPSVRASAMIPICDTDELVRTTDFTTDAIQSLAKRMGIDMSSFKKTVVKCLKTVGLIN